MPDTALVGGGRVKRRAERRAERRGGGEGKRGHAVPAVGERRRVGQSTTPGIHAAMQIGRSEATRSSQ